MGPRNEGKAIGSLVCGILGLFVFGVILGAIAIGLGVSAQRSIRRDPLMKKGNGMATAGVVLGIIDVVIFLLFVTLVDA
jgi:ABC-type phosphate transport system permease subunit